MGATYRLFLSGLLLFAVTGAVVVAPATGLAQDDSKEQARAHYTKGKELYDKEAYTEALVEFQAAHDAKPHPSVLKSVAECKVQLGDIPGAIDAFEKYLADPAASKKPDIEKRLAEVKAMLGQVTINTNPTGAGIVADGSVTGLTAPATIDLGPGDHEFVLNVDGFEPLVKQVTLKAGQKTTLDVDFDKEGIPATPLEPDLVDPFGDDSETGEVEPEIEGDDSGGPPPAFWVCAAVAGVGLVTGTVFGTMALGDEEDYKNDPTDEVKDSGERNAIIADVSFGVAAAAAIVGAVILIVDDGGEAEVSTAKNRWEVVPVAGANTLGFSTAISF